MIGTRGLALGAAGARERLEFAIAVPGVASSMEPIAGNFTDAERIMANVFDQIVTRNVDEDPEGTELRPAIATSWERTDPPTWRLAICEGVTFHNGEPLTAEDVAFSIGSERVWSEDALVPIGQRCTVSFASVEAVDDVTVEVTTSVEDLSLPNRFVTPLGCVVPRDTYVEMGSDAFDQDPVGSGPLRVMEYDPVGSVRLEVADDH